MDYKPSDFFIGVIDFFAVLVPGAIVVAVADPHIPPFLLGPKGILPRMTGGAERWIAFLFAAYLAGHMLFLLGAVLDNAFYDAFRRALVPTSKDTLFQSLRTLRTESVNVSEKEINTFQWARMGLRLSAPDALDEVERYEADSKFFRSLSIAVFGLLLVFLVVADPGPACTQLGQMSCGAFAGLVASGGVLLTFMIGKLEYDRLDDERKQQRASRRWRPRALWASVSASALILLAAVLWQRNWQALVLYVLLVLCLWRYCERRWKSTKVSYQYILFLASLPEYLRKADAASRPETGP